MPIYRPRLTDPALIPSVTSRVRLKNQKDTSFYPLVRRALELVHHERYREALAAFTKLIDRYPGHPMGYFYRAATYQILMRNYRTRRFENAFERALKLAIQKGNFLKKVIQMMRTFTFSWAELMDFAGYTGFAKGIGWVLFLTAGAEYKTCSGHWKSTP